MKTVLLMLVVTALITCLGCDTVDSPSDHSRVIAARDAGELHNEIARAFSVRLQALGDPGVPLPRKVFVRLVVEAANQALLDRGVTDVARTNDVNSVLNELVNLRNRGVFDIYSATPDDPRRIIDDWEQRGIVSAEEAAAVRARLAGDSDAYALPASERVKAVDRIIAASQSLWADPAFDVKWPGIPNRADTETPPDKSSIRNQLDGIFFLFTTLLATPAAGTVMGTTVSLIFDMLPPPPVTGGGGWDCSDYCNMG